MAMCPLLKNFLCCAGGLAFGGVLYAVVYQYRLEKERQQAVDAVYALDDAKFEAWRRKYNKA